ncbi:ATP-binding cassette domain-containing protein [Microbacterium excoecariae]|uniref:ATP-binding cassette domain-containing protein n=1 Tax=Microbacterium excoecariae TaxID=2715210 RepID=UPI00140785C4|nr:ATP-binding cassette domain-containing protein [Microbacterium excoecariae]NHI17705.1 ABC transporter ATP-binding protein [Microbacterium excoecariae]
MSLVEVQSLSKRFAGRDRLAVDDVSFTLERGSALGLVGESGSGKSTTARLVAGLIAPDAGSVTLDGQEIVGASRGTLRSARRTMQFVFQDPFASLNPRMRVRDLVGEGLLVHGIERDARRRTDRVVGTLESVGLDASHLDRYPRSFSGGQRQRIAIARAIAVRPSVLICDEPVSSLDVSVQAQVLNLLAELRESLDLALLFIAHDLAVVRYLCDRVAVMNSGRIVEQGPRDDVYLRPAHPYTRSLLEAVPIPDPALERSRREARAGQTPEGVTP